LIAAGNRAENEGTLRDACDRYRAAVEAAPDYATAHLNLGIGLENLGNVEEAIKSYEAALALDPDNPYANYNLGKLLYTRGALETAAQLLRKALDRKPEFPEAHVALANVHASQGNLVEAAASLGVALGQKSDWPGALRNYAAILRRLGRLGEAESAARRAVALEPRDATGHQDLGNLLVEEGKLDEAKVSYEAALAIDPKLPDAHLNLGNILKDRDRPEEAAACYRRALALNPDLPEAHANLGNLLRDEGRLAEAIAHYRRAVALGPGFAQAHYNLGTGLIEQGALEEAASCFRKALALQPGLAEAYAGLGNALVSAGRPGEAADCYRRALALAPDCAEAHFALGCLHKSQDRLAEAIQCYEKALSLDPGHAGARWAMAMARIPAVGDIDSRPDGGRIALLRDLEELDRWFVDARVRAGSKVVGTHTPFYLAYQEENNRELLRRHGNLCARLMADWFQRQGLPHPRGSGPDGPVRVGIVSRHFHFHSVWIALVKGWFRRLDRRRVELHAFHTGSSQDEETAVARSLASRFEQSSGGLRAWAEAILAGRLDVLIYPEIGMDAMTVRLASLRLAPVQAAAWGHPETTGLPTIDYYLSAEDFEPPGAEGNYTERLVALPHLGCCYAASSLEPARFQAESLGLDSGAPLLLCPGTPFKYAPQHDWIFAEIARRLGRCRLLFFTHSAAGLSAKLHQRLRSVFARENLDVDRFVTFIPWQSPPHFYALLKHADVYLDTIGFSGINTAMQAVECGLPIVTREGRFMRGRLASGILRRMELQELVTAGEEAYVALAVSLCRDGEYRADVRARIEARRQVLFDDPAPIHGLEDFLTGVARR
jgi:tetratricopeptide (TPR) repeat protein